MPTSLQSRTLELINHCFTWGKQMLCFNLGLQELEQDAGVNTEGTQTIDLDTRQGFAGFPAVHEFTVTNFGKSSWGMYKTVVFQLDHTQPDIQFTILDYI